MSHPIPPEIEYCCSDWHKRIFNLAYDEGDLLPTKEGPGPKAKAVLQKNIGYMRQLLQYMEKYYGLSKDP